MKSAILLFSMLLFLVSSAFAQYNMAYVHSVSGDTLVVKDDVEYGGTNTLRNLIVSDSLAPATRVYMLKAAGVYSCINSPASSANYKTVIMGPAQNIKKGTIIPPVISGAFATGVNTSGGMYCYKDLTVKNIDLEIGNSSGNNNGWAFFNFGGPNMRLHVDNCILEHTWWTWVGGPPAMQTIKFTNDYFVNLDGHSCRRNGGVLDFNSGSANQQDTLVVENCTHVNTQGTLYRFRNGFAVNRVIFNHNDFIDCAGYILMNNGDQTNLSITNNIFVNCQLQAFCPLLSTVDAGEVDADGLPMGFVNLRVNSTFTANIGTHGVYIDKNLTYWDATLSDIVSTLNTNHVDNHTDWVSQMITMNSRTTALFANKTQYPKLTNGTWISKKPTFANTDVLFTTQLAKLKAFSLATVDTSYASPLASWRQATNSEATNFVYADFPIPIDLSYTDSDLLGAGLGGFPVGDLNWFPTQLASWTAQKSSELAQIQNALDTGPSTIQNLTATTGNGQVALMWSKYAGADFLRYRIYRGTSSGAEILSDSSSNSISDTIKVVTGLSNGTKYYFRITALNTTGIESGYSNEVSARPATLNALHQYISDANTMLLMHMDEVSGSMASDTSGYLNNGTATGTTIVNGRFGKARRYNGSSDFVQIANSPSLNIRNAITVEAWVYDEDGIGGWGAKYEGTNAWDMHKNALCISRDGIENPFLNFNMQYNRWVHIAGVYDGTTESVYLNGALVASQYWPGTIASSNSRITIGTHVDQWFKGTIDEVRISNIARSPQEFNLQLPPVNLAATISGAIVNLSWQNGGGMVPLMRYKVYRGTDSINVFLIDSINATSDTNSVNSNGSYSYYYRISAVDSTGFEGTKSYAANVNNYSIMDYVSEIRSDTLVVKTQVEMGGAANALYQVLRLDTVNVPTGRVYLLKAGGVYPLQNTPTTYANRTTRIVGSDPTPLVNNKNASSALPLICGYAGGTNTNTGSIYARGNLEVRNCALSPCAPNGTEGWVFAGTSAANLHITFDNCLFEHTNWVEMYINNGNTGCSFFVSNCYFVNLNGFPCRRNGGVYDAFANPDTLWFENNTIIMAQGSIYRWRNNTAQRININHNTFVNCAGYIFMDVGSQTNVNYTNNLFINCNVQPYFPGLETVYGDEQDIDRQPMGFVNVYPDATLEANHTPRKFLVEGNNLFWSSYLSNVADTCNQILRNGKSNWTSQMILMNSRTKGMFDNNTTYPYLTEGKQYTENPQFTDPKNLFGNQLVNLKRFAVATVDTTSTDVLPDWRLVNTGENTYVYFDWSIPIDLSYSNPTLLTGATNGFPVGDINWFPARKAQWLAQRSAEYTAIQNALNNGTTTISNTVLPPPASWSFASNTGTNATIAVPTSINPRIAAQALRTGDAVGVFFLRNDSLICAGYSVWQSGQNMPITVWGDNDQSGMKDGLAEAEVMRFKIWDSQAGKEYTASAQYSSGGTTYTTNGIYVLSSIIGITSVSHSIILPQGWNMISSYVAPKDTTVDTLFSKIKSRMVIAKNGLGQVYWPALSINSIGKWNRGNGYQIYMQITDTLTIVGDEINPQQMPLALSQGWSLISYLRNSPMRSDSALGSLGANLVIAKNGSGQVYWPSLSINSIVNMRPGQGYQMYLSAGGTLTYPANAAFAPPSMLSKSSGLLAGTTEQVPKHYRINAVNTGSNSTVLVKTGEAKDGDEVAVLNTSKIVIGSGVIKSGQAVLTVWGDNALTTNSIEGAKEDEDLTLVLWINEAKAEKQLTVAALTDALANKAEAAGLKYNENRVLIAETKIAVDIPKEFTLCQNYPNPFNPTTTLTIGVPVDSKVKVEVFNVLGQLTAVLVDEVRQAGYYKVTFGGQNLPSGVYFYRMTARQTSGGQAGSFVQTKKMQLIK